MAQKGRVFLCHNSREKAAVKAVALGLLSTSGIRTWLDTWEIPGGADWEAHIRREFAASWSCLVFLGPAGFGTFQREEVAWAKERQAIDPDYRVIPVLLPDVRVEDLGELDRLLPRVHWVDLRAGDASEHGPAIANALRGDGPGPPVQALTVAVAAERWDQTGRVDRSLLVRGATLRHAQRLASDGKTFDELSLSFLAASAEMEQRRFRTGVAVLAAAVVVLAGLAWYANTKRVDAITAATGERLARGSEALQRQAAELARDDALTQKNRAEEQQKLAEARALLARSQATAADARREAGQELNLALVRAAEAFEISPSVEAQAALLETLGRARHIRQFFLCDAGEKATGVTFSSGPRASLAFSCYGRRTRIVVVDPDGRRHSPVALEGDARVFRFLGTELLAVGGHRDLRLITVANGRVRRLAGHTTAISSITALTPKWLIVSGDAAGNVREWSKDGASGWSSRPLRQATDGSQGATDLGESTCQAQYPASVRYSARAASADGALVVYTTEANELIVEDRRSASCGPVLAGHTHNVLALSVGDDGHAVASAGAIANADDTHGVILWDLQQVHALGRLTRSPSPGYVPEAGTALSADGASWAYTLGGTIWWNGHQLTALTQLQGATVSSLALSADGRELVLSTREGTIMRAVGPPPRVAWQPLKTPLTNVWGLWYAAVDVLARGSNGAIVRVLPGGGVETVQGASRDDSLCADLATTGPSIAWETGVDGGTRELRIRHFDARPPRVLPIPAGSGSCATVALSDASGIAIRSTTGYEPLYVVDSKGFTAWDNPIRSPSGLRTTLSQLRLSDDGARAVANSNRGALVILDVASRRLVGTIDIPQLDSIAVSRDAMAALTFSAAGLVRWDLDPTAWAEAARRISGRVRP